MFTVIESERGDKYFPKFHHNSGSIEYTAVRPCKLNNLFLIPVRAKFLSPSGYILCFVVEYLISGDNPRRVYIVGVAF